MNIEHEIEVADDLAGDPRDAKIRELESRVAELEATRTSEAAFEESERSRQWLDAILHSIQDDFYVLDREWRFTYASELFTGKIGKQPKDFIGREIWEMFPKHLGTPYEENLRAAMERREIRRFEIAGKYTNAVYRMTAFPSAEGITVIGTDITQQKRAADALRESQAALQAFYDSSPLMMGIAELGEDEIISVYGNAAAARFFDRSTMCIAGNASVEANSSRDVNRLWIEHYRKSQREGTAVRFEYPHPRQGGTRWISATVSFLGYSALDRPRFSFVAEDVTERREAAETLREMDRRKNEFMAMLSHELRNPLAPIKNCLYILERAAPGSEQSQRAKQTIGRQLSQLVRLVDDLLDVTRITRGKIKLQLERLDLNELVRRTIEDHRSLFAQARLRLEFAPASVAPYVQADSHRMAQIVGNLLQNAVKFTPAEGVVAVRVASDDGASQAVVSVSDSGVGMTPEMLSQLFQPFIQADSTIDRSKGGLGLGLALVKGLIELHGGSVSATSAGLYQGATFVIALPLERDSVRAPRTHTQKPRAPRQRVLIIEDNADAADSLCELLQLEQHEVVVAYDGPSGVRKARELRPTVVLCDIGLPGMNGYEVARAIRSEAIPNLLSLVALSGYSLREDVQRAKEAGFDRHLAKPPSLSQLKSLFAALPSADATAM